jgi:hypothetical protein
MKKNKFKFLRKNHRQKYMRKYTEATNLSKLNPTFRYFYRLNKVSLISFLIIIIILFSSIVLMVNAHSYVSEATQIYSLVFSIVIFLSSSILTIGITYNNWCDNITHSNSHVRILPRIEDIKFNDIEKFPKMNSDYDFIPFSKPLNSDINSEKKAFKLDFCNKSSKDIMEMWFDSVYVKHNNSKESAYDKLVLKDDSIDTNKFQRISYDKEKKYMLLLDNIHIKNDDTIFLVLKFICEEGVPYVFVCEFSFCKDEKRYLISQTTMDLVHYKYLCDKIDLDFVNTNLTKKGVYRGVVLENFDDKDVVKK